MKLCRPVGKRWDAGSLQQLHMGRSVVPESGNVAKHFSAQPRRVDPRRARTGVFLYLRGGGVFIGAAHSDIVAQPKATVPTAQIVLSFLVGVPELLKWQRLSSHVDLTFGNQRQVCFWDTLETDVRMEKQLVHNRLVAGKVEHRGLVGPGYHRAATRAHARSIQFRNVDVGRKVGKTVLHCRRGNRAQKGARRPPVLLVHLRRQHVHSNRMNMHSSGVPQRRSVVGVDPAIRRCSSNEGAASITQVYRPELVGSKDCTRQNNPNLANTQRGQVTVPRIKRVVGHHRVLHRCLVPIVHGDRAPTIVIVIHLDTLSNEVGAWVQADGNIHGCFLLLTGGGGNMPDAGAANKSLVWV